MPCLSHDASSEQGFQSKFMVTACEVSTYDLTCTMESHSRMLARNLLPNPSPVLAPFTRPAMSTNSMLVGTSFFDFDRSLSICIHRLLFCCVLHSQWTLPRKALQLNKVPTCNLSSGTATTPMFGSMVQKGKFAAWAFAFLQMALNKVDCTHTEGSLHVTGQMTSLCQDMVPVMTVAACEGTCWYVNAVIRASLALPTFGIPTIPVFRAMLTTEDLQTQVSHCNNCKC